MTPPPPRKVFVHRNVHDLCKLTFKLIPSPSTVRIPGEQIVTARNPGLSLIGPTVCRLSVIGHFASCGDKADGCTSVQYNVFIVAPMYFRGVQVVRSNPPHVPLLQFHGEIYDKICKMLKMNTLLMDLTPPPPPSRNPGSAPSRVTGYLKTQSIIFFFIL